MDLSIEAGIELISILITLVGGTGVVYTLKSDTTWLKRLLAEHVASDAKNFEYLRDRMDGMSSARKTGT